ncbi:septal ring lytic transglycosylase RlpA family protein [bacterium]|nr:septal ring lytic transglycosylase RlpA family protein [bacterium]
MVLSGCTAYPVYRDTRSRSYEPAARAQQQRAPEQQQTHPTTTTGEVLTGFASYYGPKFVGRPTANGEIFDPRQMTCAHRTLPFNTMLRVTLISSGKSVVVRVNDRGPYAKDRIIDLSEAAAEKIGLKAVGVGYVQAEILEGDGE